MMSPRRFFLRAISAGLLAAVGACASAPAPQPRATLQVVSNVPDASLWVDDRYAGPAAAWSKGVSISAGFHRVELRHPGHFSYFAEVNAKEGETVKLAPVMRPTLD